MSPASRQSAAPTRCCPVCAGEETESVARFDGALVHCNLIWRSREDAVDVPRADIELAVCPGCGHLFNRVFDPALMRYGEQYENSLDFSDTFRRYASSLAERLVERHGLRGKTIVELGCGSGEFVKLLCERGDNRGFGFDPGVPESGARIAVGRGVTLIRGNWSPGQPARRVDFVCCRHVLEHLDSPLQFLTEVHEALYPSGSATAYFEVPNGLYILRELSGWDILYEHFSYFTPSSLVHLVESASFSVASVQECFGGQFLGVETSATRDGSGPSPDVTLGGPGATEPELDRRDPSGALQGEMGESVASALAVARTFGDRWRLHTERLRGNLETARRAGRRTVVWGAGSKGVMFLNALGEAGAVEYAVDVNPRKRGRFVAGGGQLIVEPAFLQDYRPDAVVVMNSNYTEEIRATLAELGVSCQVIPA